MEIGKFPIGLQGALHNIASLRVLQVHTLVFEGSYTLTRESVFSFMSRGHDHDSFDSSGINATTPPVTKLR